MSDTLGVILLFMVSLLVGAWIGDMLFKATRK